MCGEGKRQSPVNIVTKQAVSAPNLDTLTRTYAAADATVINNGHDISVRTRVIHSFAFSDEMVYNLFDPSRYIDRRGRLAFFPDDDAMQCTQLTFEDKVGNITVDGNVYNLDKMHWHMPSEHTINGQRYPLEMHLVHKSDAGDLAVIAVLYQYGAPDSFYFQVHTQAHPPCMSI
jgi:carbonic anhydrase